mmetsp:Transcript_77793/g.186655  ORF Transcript_77793/g.186655 Transcript_77793/m.186655 type:complete len:178 (+) Transcript_77793:86-619(+)|eukprot:CAMPEP_0181526790 /NCGR_PEP_ID=MMETSP1110-20121109/69670_1 /TAXON_ID=174948 /ORGANISM="Symbiodinium sp., Strain CCMP421" /LENGTH=177 /DNA_ID=CAMNT_0023657647 /DNA_START=51 /DNA_END=584 /DNA_ORIENTATION=+
MLDCLSAEGCVYLAGILTLLRAVAFLCAVDADANVIIAGTSFGANLQVIATCLALSGVPILVMAVFGMNWHIGLYVRRFAHYLVASLVFDSFLLAMLPASGLMCTALANEYVLQSGRIFVCGFINAAYGFWAIVLVLLEIQLVRKVHQQAQLVEQGEHTELLRYERKPVDINAFTAG